MVSSTTPLQTVIIVEQIHYLYVQSGEPHYRNLLLRMKPTGQVHLQVMLLLMDKLVREIALHTEVIKGMKHLLFF